MANTKRMTHLELIEMSRAVPATPVVAPAPKRALAAAAAVMSAEFEANVRQYRTVRNLVQASAEEVIARNNLGFLNEYRAKHGLEPL